MSSGSTSTGCGRRWRRTGRANEPAPTGPVPVRYRKGTGSSSTGDDEAALILRLVGELRSLLTEETTDPHARVLLARLFPTAYPDDDELEDEYQRLMREELVASKLAALDVVDGGARRRSCAYSTMPGCSR